MQQQVDIQKLERILNQQAQQITALAKAVDEGNARYCALSSLILGLPNVSGADRKLALSHLSQMRIRQLGPGLWGPADLAHQELTSLLAEAKVPAVPEESAA